MYETHFGFTEPPFSIAPNPRYLYMSAHHREAMAHLLYGVREGGGFVQLTGEVGTGKTTLCRHLLSELPEQVEVALILNPRIDELELMQSVCDELRITYDKDATIKQLLDALNRYLLEAHAAGKHTVLIIDEAQNLSSGVLEQVRLLTNLETSQKKLLQIILIGQTELKETLSRRELRQLSQRVTARYHLNPLSRKDVAEYIGHRLKQSGCERQLFSRRAISRIFKISRGVPRIVNVLCDRALLGAYSEGRHEVSAAIVNAAGREVSGELPRRNRLQIAAAILALLLVLPLGAYKLGLMPEPVNRMVEKWMPTWMNQWMEPLKLVQRDFILITTAHAASSDLHLDFSDLDDAEITNELFRKQPRPFLLSQLPRLTTGNLTDLLRPSGNRNRSRVAALRQLTRLWSMPDNIVIDCVSVRELGLDCYQTRGGWERLTVFNRPAMIELQRDQASLGYLVLEALIGDDAVLILDNDRYRINWNDLNQHWNGEATILWRLPPLADAVVNDQSTVEDILWVRRVLNLLASNTGGQVLEQVEIGEFDSELIDLLHDFQSSAGLGISDEFGITESIVVDARIHRESTPVLQD